MRSPRRSRSSTAASTGRADGPRRLTRRPSLWLAASALALATGGVLAGGPLAAAAQAPMPAASTAPSPSASPSHAPSPSPSPSPSGPGCQVSYVVTSVWATGFQISVTITDNGPAITSWTLQYSYATSDETLANGFNATWSQSGRTITAVNTAYNGSLATGGSTTIGATFNLNGPPDTPHIFTINGFVCNGAGGTISGTVANSSGSDLSGLSVRVCVVATTTCAGATTSVSGFYSVGGLADGSYQVDVDDPPLLPGHAGPIAIAGGNAQTANLVLLANIPLPPGVGISGATGNPPLIHWNQATPFSVAGRCANGVANFAITQNGAVIAAGPMTETPKGSGTYTGVIPPFAPHNHGYAQITVTVVCPDGSTQVVPFCIYIDPSGVVQTPDGLPIDGATVTLLSAASAGGPFTPVPNGSDIMSPANQTNPMVTAANGHFGWDTQAGYYEVQASKPGCHTPTTPQAAIASTAVLQVPPAATGLVLTLDCTGSPAPAITSADQASFTAGTGGAFTVTATGAPAPTVSESGDLPSGVSFTSNNDGTATLTVSATAAAGTTTFTVDAGNGVGADATQLFTLTVVGASGPAITSGSSANFTAGTAGTFTVVSAGTPTPTLAESGTLPSGVTFTSNSDGTATLAVGAGAAAGSTTLTLTASNGTGPDVQQSFELNIVAPAPAITSPAAAAFTLTAGTAGTFTVTSTGSPTPTLTQTGTLPSGVTFTPNGNGTATLAVSAGAPTGTMTLTFTASSTVSPSTAQSFTLTINPAPPAPVITSAASARFIAGTGGTFTVTATGSPIPLLSETGTLPSGVTFTPNSNGTATLSVGVGASAGSSTLTFAASNGVTPNAGQTFTLHIDQPAPAITSPSSASFTAGTAVTFTVTSTGSPTPTLSENGTLPSGVAFTPNSDGTATISISASAAIGTSTLTIAAANGVTPGAGQTFTLNVN